MATLYTWNLCVTLCVNCAKKKIQLFERTNTMYELLPMLTKKKAKDIYFKYQEEKKGYTLLT